MIAADNIAPGIEFQRFRVRGTSVAAIDLERACDLIGQLATEGQGSYVTVTGAHGIVESVYSDRVREAHQQATMVVPDGMPLVWLGRLLGFNSIGRVYGPDLMASVFSRKELRQLKHYFYGSTPAIIDRLTATLRSQFGEFTLVGVYSPPIRPVGFAEAEDLLSRIRELKPHIIWVGLSTPKQEIWLHDHMGRIGSGVGIGVGAAFDLVSGTTRQAPRWVQRSGLEWLFRLGVEPRRLVRRYFFIVPRFLYYMAETLIIDNRQSLKKHDS
jgi:N-acetylglucosaminyldiphosphoundecaprenol N-acetyl-beta-D-mannosaminyltransferase